jgi:dienelactone hydrolase
MGASMYGFGFSWNCRTAMLAPPHIDGLVSGHRVKAGISVHPAANRQPSENRPTRNGDRQ